MIRKSETDLFWKAIYSGSPSLARTTQNVIDSDIVLLFGKQIFTFFTNPQWKSLNLDRAYRFGIKTSAADQTDYAECSNDLRGVIENVWPSIGRNGEQSGI